MPIFRKQKYFTSWLRRERSRQDVGKNIPSNLDWKPEITIETQQEGWVGWWLSRVTGTSDSGAKAVLKKKDWN